jgi:hypothetical protein
MSWISKTYAAMKTKAEFLVLQREKWEVKNKRDSVCE